MVYTIFMNDCIAVFVHRSVLDLRISMTMSYVLFFSFLFAHGQLYTLLECLLSWPELDDIVGAACALAVQPEAWIDVPMLAHIESNWPLLDLSHSCGILLWFGSPTAKSRVISIILSISHFTLCYAYQNCAKLTYHAQIHSIWSVLWCFLCRDRDGKVGIEEVIAATN
jgi:hypothetical protein